VSSEKRKKSCNDWKKRNRAAMTAYRKKWLKEHPEKRREYANRYWAKNPDRYNALRRKFMAAHPGYHRKYYNKARLEAINHYGGKCACCGEGKYEFLAIDHMNGGGSGHRRDLSQKGVKFLTWLKKNNYPDGFQILCFNCNMSLGFRGYCPHHPEVTRPVSRRRQ
jgi:hypothetical protein